MLSNKSANVLKHFNFSLPHYDICMISTCTKSHRKRHLKFPSYEKCCIVFLLHCFTVWANQTIKHVQIKQNKVFDLGVITQKHRKTPNGGGPLENHKNKKVVTWGKKLRNIVQKLVLEFKS